MIYLLVGQKTPSARIRTIFRLNMISTLFSSLNTDLDDEPRNEDSVQPVLLVMEKTMPIFRSIAELWVDEIDVLEVRWKYLFIYFSITLNTYFTGCL